MDNYQKLAIKEAQLKQLLQQWYNIETPEEFTAIGLDSTGTAASALTFIELQKVGVPIIPNFIISTIAYRGGKLLSLKNRREYAVKANQKNYHRNLKIKLLIGQINKLSLIIANEEKTQQEAKDQLRRQQIDKIQAEQELRAVANNPLIKQGEGYKQVSAKDFAKLPTHKYELTGKWKTLFGYFKKIRGSILIWGKRKNGKTHFCVQLGEYLERVFGKVLYFSAEEGVEETFKTVAIRWKGNFDVIFEMKGLETIENAIKENTPKFVFFDSTSRLKLKIDELVYLKDQYPNTFFFYVMHSNQDGSAKGGSSPEHEVDALVEVIEGIAYQEGRMVNGRTEMAVFPDLE